MSAIPATDKGAATRETIIDRAYGIACSAGLEGLSIGPLAQAVGMSKSGVFAHFGSREDLQLAVLDSAAYRFGEFVLIPALKAKRGLPRLRTILSNWLEWVRGSEGGCLLITAASEYDDRPGALRDRVLHHEMDWRSQLERAVQQTIESGELAADTDASLLVFELYAIALCVHHEAGLFGYAAARDRGERALERLLVASAPVSSPRSYE